MEAPCCQSVSRANSFAKAMFLVSPCPSHSPYLSHPSQPCLLSWVFSPFLSSRWALLGPTSIGKVKRQTLPRVLFWPTRCGWTLRRGGTFGGPRWRMWNIKGMQAVQSGVGPKLRSIVTALSPGQLGRLTRNWRTSIHQKRQRDWTAEDWLLRGTVSFRPWDLGG